MDFFGIGFGEILLIIVIALIIFGPGRLPEIARTIGRMTRSLRKATSDFTTSLTKEINTVEKDQSSQPKAARSGQGLINHRLNPRMPPPMNPLRLKNENREMSEALSRK